MEENDVVVVGEKSSVGIFYYIERFLPWLMFIFIFLFIAKQNSAQNNRGFQFGKSPARLFEPKANSVTFKDVAGQVEAKEDLAGNKKLSELSKDAGQFMERRKNRVENKNRTFDDERSM